ncbi:uncharacterized protein B0H18DRAFT_1122982 [Fomitopsis serialis]|uniref:uncharacterized protein n=1 Tax=Fomitopsis serialis TaxID=139415 RepID=UPI0020089021|nr:uncharacterized protein B0H18DRAFT_1122982 [Neoantrodia serialis]KAH9918470.1 hypothetical protein B0H18DRAFT_1122982 [Neoantrodia serialis]
MARILLACLVGKIPKKAILAFRSILDFIYLAQYTTHDDTTLQYMEDALKTFHSNKTILVDLGVRDHLNIPKFHSLLHYVDAIRLLGTTDNYNTEAFERLHIDYAKKGWRASNHRDARPQMVRWLARQEKMVVLSSTIHRWLRSTGRERRDDVSVRHADDVDNPDQDSVSGSRHNGRIKLAKHPSAPLQALPTIVDKHHAPGFIDTLAQYIYTLKNGRPLASSQLNNAINHMPFQRLDVFHGFKFTPEPLTDDTQETDAVKARPAIAKQPARFDTVVVLQEDDAEATGLQGTRIGRIKVIFKLPQNIRDPRTLRPLQAPSEWASQGPLAGTTRGIALQLIKGLWWWAKADEPWQCLATCMPELINALDAHDLLAYECALPAGEKVTGHTGDRVGVNLKANDRAHKRASERQGEQRASGQTGRRPYSRAHHTPTTSAAGDRAGQRDCKRTGGPAEGCVGCADQEAKKAARGASSPPDEITALLRSALPSSISAIRRHLLEQIKAAAVQRWKESPRFEALARIDPEMPSKSSEPDTHRSTTTSIASADPTQRAVPHAEPTERPSDTSSSSARNTLHNAHGYDAKSEAEYDLSGTYSRKPTPSDRFSAIYTPPAVSTTPSEDLTYQTPRTMSDDDLLSHAHP